MYGHWITVIMIMAAGLGGASLFALGYLILAFWMLWQVSRFRYYKMYDIILHLLYRAITSTR